MSVMRPDLIMKSVIPVVMAGIIAIYGLVVSVLIANKCKSLQLDLVGTEAPNHEDKLPLCNKNTHPSPVSISARFIYNLT